MEFKDYRAGEVAEFLLSCGVGREEFGDLFYDLLMRTGRHPTRSLEEIRDFIVEF